MTHLPNQQETQEPRETYTTAGSKAFPKFLASRSVENHAAFFLPYLQPGMNLLDCGCGPGTITVGLARIVAPGQTVGIDIAASQIEVAQQQVASQATPPIRFETASVYELPFADQTFDAVFSHALIEHLGEPLAALREMQRVLKPGGVVGIRSIDKDGQLLAPPDPLPYRFWEIGLKMLALNGANVYVGKHLGAYLRQAGFVDVKASASYDVHSSAAATQLWAETAVGLLEEENFVRQFLSVGALERSELEEFRRAWLVWGQHPDAIYADAYGDAVGWKAET
jgi:ubiquinone/menaquinone biosynthesis C-methylase UbiE